MWISLLLGLNVLASTGVLLAAGFWDGVIEKLIGVLASAVAAAVVWLVGMLAKKLKIDLETEQKKAIREAAREAILWVAEKAAVEKKLKSVTLDSKKKLDLAADRLIKKYPKLPLGEARDIIEENLASVGEGAAAEALDFRSSRIRGSFH